MRVLAAIVVAALAAIAVSAALASSAANRVVAHVPLPAPGAASVRLLNVTVTSKTAQLARIQLHVLNDKAFGNASAVAVVASPTKASKRGLARVYVLVRRFGTPDRQVATAADGSLALEVRGRNTNGIAQIGIVQGGVQSCALIKLLDNLFESGGTPVESRGFAWTVQTLRPLTVQDSPPEEVLDNVLDLSAAQASCPAAEGDDPGPK